MKEYRTNFATTKWRAPKRGKEGMRRYFASSDVKTTTPFSIIRMTLEEFGK